MHAALSTWAVLDDAVKQFAEDDGVTEPLEQVEHDEVHESDVQISCNSSTYHKTGLQ